MSLRTVSAPYSALDPEADQPVASVLVMSRPGGSRCNELAEIGAAIRALECRRRVLLRLVARDEAVSRADRSKAAIVDLVSREFQVTPAEILGGSRFPRIAEARHAVRWLMWITSGCSMNELGRNLGCDHALIRYSCVVIQNRLDTEPKFAERMGRLKADAIEIAPKP